jgi:tRNA nucleotidyltransferase (CCA-adding enzyme)
LAKVESKEVGFSVYLARCLCLIYSYFLSLLETFSDVEQSKQFLGGSMTECRDNIVQRDNQNPYIEGEQTTQWPKDKEQKDK